MIPSFTRIVELAPDVVPVEPGAVFCARCLMLHGMSSRRRALRWHDRLVVLDASRMIPLPWLRAGVFICLEMMSTLRLPSAEASCVIRSPSVVMPRFVPVDEGFPLDSISRGMRTGPKPHP